MVEIEERMENSRQKEAGYDSREKIINLVQEIKQEMATEPQSHV